MSIKLVVLTHDSRWKGLGPTVKRAAMVVVSELCPGGLLPLPRKGGAGSLAVTPESYKAIHVTILLTNDAEVKALNAQYRGKNKPTNVLSFPDGSEEMGARGKIMLNLGDIAMAYETIAAEAAAQGKALKHHISHLAIHGSLHLLGFDHEEEAEAETMEALEIAILARMGIANPYESR